MADKMSVDKKEPDSDDSGVSSPDVELGPGHSTQEGGQQPKRKGGRKPIYATSEERKQRNRQAQAAFRERRTEYIKHLEETIRVHEQNLHSLQTAHRTAADECLMLRYKNSLLERILLEKGIDVQAELRAKTGSPNFGPTHVPQNLVQPPPMSRSMLNRQHGRRSTSSVTPKIEPGLAVLPPPLAAVTSPKGRPRQPSHSTSPSATTTSAFGASPSGSGSDHLSAVSARSSQPTAARAPPSLAGAIGGMTAAQRTMHQQHMQQAAHAHAAGASGAPPYYPTPAFQNHMEQLEQEYDAVDMLDDPADGPDTPPAPGPYLGGAFSVGPPPMGIPVPSTTAGASMLGPAGLAGVPPAGDAQQPVYPTMTQLLDPGLDWDPFGLSASMQFPTQFSFDTSNMR